MAVFQIQHFKCNSNTPQAKYAICVTQTEAKANSNEIHFLWWLFWSIIATNEIFFWIEALEDYYLYSGFHFDSPLLDYPCSELCNFLWHFLFKFNRFLKTFNFVLYFNFKYSQTSANDHLQIKTICLQRLLFWSPDFRI